MMEVVRGYIPEGGKVQLAAARKSHKKEYTSKHTMHFKLDLIFPKNNVQVSIVYTVIVL
jgi:hypothetical protein